MAKLIPLDNNSGNENRPSDEELNQMFGAFMGAFFDDSDYWDDLFEGPTPFAYSVSSSDKKKRKKPRKKSTDRQVPNYAYKPKGEDPEGYFVKKIHSVIRWRVANANDVNYGLRVFEGWLAQAQKYVAKEEFYYAVCITRALLSDVLTCHLFWHHEYPKQMARVRKLERAVSEVYYQCLSFSKDKNFNWIDLCLDLLQKESYPFNSKGEAGFDVEDYIEKVIALLPDEKAKQYRDAHPTDKQLLEKPIPVCLPDKIEMPQGLNEKDKAPYITDFIDEIPNAQYPSLIVSLCEIVTTHEKKLKSFGIVKAEELRKMQAEYENFVLAYHRGGIDDFRKYSNYTLTRPFWSFVYNYHFPITNTASKNKFLQQVVEPYLDLVWRQWDSPKLQSKFDEVKEKAVKAQALKQEREESLASMPSYLEGLTSDQYLAFHEQALRILNRDKKKLSESSGILKVDIEHRYQPLLKLLKGTRDIEDSLDAKVRQGIDSIFLSIYQVLWDYMLYPYDLDYIIENKKVVKKVLDEIWKICMRLGQEAKSPPKVW